MVSGMRLLCALALLLTVALAARDASARPFDLGGARIITTDHVDLSALRPEDSLLLLHPERSLDAASLRRFMKAGGRVVLLDDYGTGDGLLDHFGMERIPAPRHPADALRKNSS